MYCINCNLETSGKKYCSIACQLNYQQAQYISRWQQGLETGLKGKRDELSNHVRHYLFKKYNNSCAVCGWSEVNIHTNKIPLQVHHKNGLFQDCTEVNLILLCPNCHALTENYGSKNKHGEGRRSKGKF